MKTNRSIRAILPLIFAGLILPQPAASEDGPIRAWLKERREQRSREADAGSDTKITRPGDYAFTAEHGGLTRRYRVHVPQGYDPAKPAPVLFALHGGGGNMNLQANDRRYGLISASERHGFIAVFPNGYSRLRSGAFATWNAGACCGDARDNDIDDVGFIRRVVDDVSRKLNVDRDRFFAAGMSNGGMMAYRLACEMPDTFKAIAAVAGTDNTTTCRAKQPISILHIHARNDDHVLFEGGAGPNAFRDISKVTQFTSVAATIAKWVAVDRCDPTPKRIHEEPGAYCDLYSPCQANVRIQLCVTDTGGHSWPGGTKPGRESPSSAISANDVMWKFFTGPYRHGIRRRGRKSSCCVEARSPTAIDAGVPKPPPADAATFNGAAARSRSASPSYSRSRAEC